MPIKTLLRYVKCQVFFCFYGVVLLTKCSAFALFVSLPLPLPLFFSLFSFGHMKTWFQQWQTLAEAAKAKSCFWRFVLLHLSILRADVLLDSSGGEEMAEIEALLEEAAELVDDSLPKNPNYYR